MPQGDRYVQIEGAAEIDRLLGDIVREYGTQRAVAPMRKVLRAVVTPAANQVRAKVRRRTGNMAESYRISSSRGSDGGVRVFAGWSHTSGVPRSPRTQRTSKLLGAFYGNVRFPNPQRELLEITFDSHEPRMTAQFNRDYGDEVERTMARLARKRGLRSTPGQRRIGRIR